MSTKLARSEEHSENQIEEASSTNRFSAVYLPIVLIGIIIVLVVLFFKVISPGRTAGPSAREFNLTLENETYQPKIIEVNLNDRVTLNIENKDNVNHGLHLPEFDVVESILPLSRKQIIFTAAKQGMLAGSCANEAHKENLTVNVL